MNFRKRFAISCSLSCLALVLSASYALAGGADKYSCSEPNPAQMCNASNTCGSGSAPCSVDVQRRGSTSASSTPEIPGAKRNAPFCVAAGTTLTWHSSSKDTGFILDFGPSSPFDKPGAIIGGSDRTVSVVAKKSGCFKYSTGACTPGTIYGMCGSAESELIITNGGK
ncbi:MAG: hypothetical protein JO210_14970 [Acidobacteriaceae bacterium]|nr:hypothetical protein [Acidobacteriaceae bacterium]